MYKSNHPFIKEFLQATLTNSLLDNFSNMQSYKNGNKSSAQSLYGDIQILYENSQHMQCFLISHDDIDLYQSEKKVKITTS